jgi:uridine kinase
MINFYIPIRGSMRRQRSRASSLIPDEGDVEQSRKIHTEIKDIDLITNFDDPKQIDYDLLIKGLQLLTVERVPFNMPLYDKYLKIREEKTISISPAPIIIVEGTLSLCNAELREMFDLSVWIDTDDDVRLSRRVLKNELQTGVRHKPLAELL